MITGAQGGSRDLSAINECPIGAPQINERPTFWRRLNACVLSRNFIVENAKIVVRSSSQFPRTRTGGLRITEIPARTLPQFITLPLIGALHDE